MELEKNIIIREIKTDDFENYMKLMYEFTNYKKDISNIEFKNKLFFMKDNNLCCILVIEKLNQIIGAGTIFNLNKLHNNSVGQIEDVIIDSSFRGLGYGKLLIDKLVEIGKTKYNCYKIILNCIEKNVNFYEKCNFEIVGVEMKYLN